MKKDTFEIWAFSEAQEKFIRLLYKLHLVKFISRDEVFTVYDGDNPLFVSYYLDGFKFFEGFANLVLDTVLTNKLVKEREERLHRYVEFMDPENSQK